ncbi:MAG: molybdopterin-dependent oxidoreductase [Anaerolineae bacterium]
MRRKGLVLLVLLVLASTLAGCARERFESVTVDTSDLPEVSWELRISGAVSEPMTLAYQELASRELVKLDDILERCDCGDETENAWEGIALVDLLEEAGASKKATGVIFRGADGYWREASIDDLQVAMVGIRRDGEWLADDPEDGPIRMVVPGLSASYWISQVVEIEVVE